MSPLLAPSSWPVWGLAALAGTAVVWDIRYRRLPNWLTVAAAGFGVVLHTYLAATAGLGAALGGVAVGMAILLPGFLAHATGAGDVKLMAAAGAFLGPYPALVAALASIACGAILALAWAATATLTGHGAAPWGRYWLMLRTLVGTGRVDYVAPAEGEVMGRRFPFAIAIAAGVAVALWHLGPGNLGAGVGTPA